MTSRRDISEATGLSERSVRTILDKLENTGEISRSGAKRNSILTLCNYESYQSEDTLKRPNQNEGSDQIKRQKTTKRNKAKTTKREKDQTSIIPGLLDDLNENIDEKRPNQNEEKRPKKTPKNDQSTYKKDIVNKNKEKYIKEKFADYVSMTRAQYETLVNERGQEFADACIDKLNSYKGSRGKKYKDDYLAIRNWVIGEVEKTLFQNSNSPFI